jgi:hypothetical protein
MLRVLQENSEDAEAIRPTCSSRQCLNDLSHVNSSFTSNNRADTIDYFVAAQSSVPEPQVPRMRMTAETTAFDREVGTHAYVYRGRSRRQL